MTNTINNYFSTVFITEDVHRNLPTTTPQTQVVTMPDFKVTENEILSIMNGMNISKTPVPDKISPRLLKGAKTTIFIHRMYFFTYLLLILTFTMLPNYPAIFFCRIPPLATLPPSANTIILFEAAVNSGEDGRILYCYAGPCPHTASIATTTGTHLPKLAA